jgi:hypothetical protein
VILVLRRARETTTAVQPSIALVSLPVAAEGRGRRGEDSSGRSNENYNFFPPKWHCITRLA